jgi:scyllo-inositol 2-dehydrogenase (NADP+)
MGAHHARLIREVEGLTLRGVCDTDEVKRAKALAENPGIVTYNDYEKVLADPNVNCIVIVTPHNVHAEMAIAAMDAGKHAITDKAMCLTVVEAREMMAARDRNNVIFSVFHNRRWDSDFITVRKILDEGLLGPLHHIQSCVTSQGNVGGWRTNRSTMGGWLFDWGAHTIDQILLLTSARPTHVYAFTHHRMNDPQEVEDYINCIITFDNGPTATTVIGYINPLPMPRWYVMGERATLQADDFEKPVRIKGMLGNIEAETSVKLIKGDWKSFYQNIADVLAGRAELDVKPEQLIPQIAIAQAAYRSIEIEQVVAVEF